MIPNSNAIQVFLFENKPNGKGKYLGEATELSLAKIDQVKTEKTVTGLLPDVVIGKTVKLVFMANFGYRKSNITEKTKVGITYNDWKNAIYFDYATTANHTSVFKDDLYIPMSGECVIKIKRGTNTASVDLMRARAKVRITIDPNSLYGMRDFFVHNAQSRSYCFQHVSNVSGTDYDLDVPNSPDGAERSFAQPILPNNKKTPNFIEFYVTEKSMKEVNGRLPISISFKFCDPNTQEALGDEETLIFKNYVSGNAFHVERNNYYKFNIKAVSEIQSGGPIDITTTIQRWDIVNLTTDFE